MNRFLLVIVLSITGLTNAQTFSWAYNYDNYWSDEAYGMGLDSTGNIYVTGLSKFVGGNSQASGYFMFYKFNPNGILLWKDTLTHGVVKSVTDLNGNTFMVAGNTVYKYNSTGQQQWIQTIPNKILRSLCLHPAGGIVVIGFTNVGNNSIGVAYRVDIGGNILWSRTGDFSGEPTAVACDGSGNAYLTGDSAVSTGLVSKLKKFDNNGIPVLVKQVLYEPYGITVANDSSIFILGQHYSSTSTNTLYIAKYNPQGNLLWNSLIINPNAYISSIKANATNDIIVVGGYYQSIQSGNITLTAPAREMCIFNISKQGATLWGKSTSGPAYVNGNSNGWLSPLDLIINKNSQIIIAGAMYGKHNFDAIIVNDSSLYTDVFICKLSQTAVITSVSTQNKTVQIVGIYPSPTSGIFNVECPGLGRCNLIVSITNSMGQRVYIESHSHFEGDYSKVFDLGKLSKGIYFVEVNTGERRTVKKVVLE